MENKKESQEVVKCSHCNGTGIVDNYSERTCSSCGGIGKESISIEAAYDQGWNAGYDDSNEDCPYHEGTFEYEAWYQGREDGAWQS